MTVLIIQNEKLWFTRMWWKITCHIITRTGCCDLPILHFFVSLFPFKGSFHAMRHYSVVTLFNVPFSVNSVFCRVVFEGKHFSRVIVIIVTLKNTSSSIVLMMWIDNEDKDNDYDGTINNYFKNMIMMMVMVPLTTFLRAFWFVFLSTGNDEIVIIFIILRQKNTLPYVEVKRKNTFSSVTAKGKDLVARLEFIAENEK